MSKLLTLLLQFLPLLLEKLLNKKAPDPKPQRAVIVNEFLKHKLRSRAAAQRKEN